MDSDWDLTAVVRSCKSTTPTTTSFSDHHPKIPSFSQNQHQYQNTTPHITEQQLFSYKNNHNTVMVTGFSDDEYRDQSQAQLLRRQQQQIMQMQYSYYQNYFDHHHDTSATITTATTNDDNDVVVLQDFIRPALQPRPVPLQGYDSSSHFNLINVVPSAVSDSTRGQNLNMQVSLVNNKPNKKKNEGKKIVRMVTKENLCSDIWAWRKYGQKPIKGSPYPRSYYRCSSVKGCSARRQMERSHQNPQFYILTYTGEHGHPPPEDRNSSTDTTAAAVTATATTAAANQNNEPIIDEFDDLLMHDMDLFDDTFFDFLFN